MVKVVYNNLFLKGDTLKSFSVQVFFRYHLFCFQTIFAGVEEG